MHCEATNFLAVSSRTHATMTSLIDRLGDILPLLERQKRECPLRLILPSCICDLLCSVKRLPRRMSLANYTVLLYESHATERHLLRSLSFSYQKKDWEAVPRQSFFSYDTNFTIYSNLKSARQVQCTTIVGVIPKEG